MANVINCPTTQVTCDANGEVKVADIIENINQLVASCDEFAIFHDKYKDADVIRIFKVPGENVMYMTNDGSDPDPSA